MTINFDDITPYVSLDTECTGIDFHRGDMPFAISFCTENGDIFFYEWPVDPLTRKVTPNQDHLFYIQAIIDDADFIVFHNAKFDIAALARIGIHVPWKKVHDTIIASHVLDNTDSHRLDDLAEQYLDIPSSITNNLREETVRARAYGKRANWKLGVSPQRKPEVPRDYWMCCLVDPESTTLEEYAKQDASNTILLWDLFSRELKKQDLWSQYEKRRQLLPVVYSMEKRGITISRKRLNSEIKRYTYEEDLRHSKVKAIGIEQTGNIGFNPNSSTQVAKILYDKFSLPEINYTASGNPSTDRNTLIELLNEAYIDEYKSEEFLTYLLEMKKYSTSLRYLTSYEYYAKRELGTRLFPSINITGTTTTRFSSSNPNSQNVGKGDEWETEFGVEEDFNLRDIFGPMTGRIWYAIDYSQLQLRIFAYASEEDSLIQAFRDGYDFHQYVACRIFNKDPEEVTKRERRIAKNVNFGVIFGAGESKIDATSGITGLYNLFRKQFPNIDSYMSANISTARKKGYVETLGGYRMYVPRDKPYKSTNYIIQGTEGEIVQRAMVSCYDYLQKQSTNYSKTLGDFFTPYLCMQVHDELVFDFPIEDHNGIHLQSLVQKMELAGEFFGVETPVDVDVITEKWSDGKALTTLVGVG